MSTDGHQRITELVYRYAKACDRRDVALLASCLHPELELIVPGMPPMGGPEQAQRTVETLEQLFELTRHCVHNSLFDVTGDTAEGEVYCVAGHLLRERRDGLGVVDEWAVRYQDKLVLTDSGWQFIRRELTVDWKQERLVTV